MNAHQTDLELTVEPPETGLADLTGGWAVYPTELARLCSQGAIARYIILTSAYYERREVPGELDQYDEELLQKGFLRRGEDGKIWLAD